MSALLVLGALGALVWFWFDSLQARELAIRVGTRACAEINMQFLDQTVSVTRLRLGRDARGHLKVLRTFSFEFSGDGVERLHGTVVVLGNQVRSTTLDSPDGKALLISPKDT